ncbi:MAG: hypothetical protein HW388_490 [Dehalococcoidia bacterium]|nr:hypothetical protein [Dehalococcoidia bacterium]
MLFDVAQLLKEGVGAREGYSLDEAVEALQESGTTRVWGNMTLTCTDKGIWVSGKIEANASGPCSRCLNPIEYPVRFRMEEEYLPTVDLGSGMPLEVPEVKDGAFTIDSHHILDLTEAVRQYFIVNLPMKPLCKEHCAGLCPRCGANLNEGGCDCSAQVDPRWSALLDLLPTGKR